MFGIFKTQKKNWIMTKSKIITLLKFFFNPNLVDMRSLLLLCFVLLLQVGAAQNFFEAPSFVLKGVEYSSVAFSDVDGDGDQDVLITGDEGPEPLVNPVSILYINDGNGNFIEAESTPFDPVDFGSVAFSDVDMDGDEDVMITGQNDQGTTIAKLYLNDGGGHFTEVPETPFDGVRFSAIAFADINGDTAEEVLITGENKLGQRIAKLYLNDGAGTFEELETDTIFQGVSKGDIAFADVDGDLDQDVVITGFDDFLEGTAYLYLNDGTGNFTPDYSAPFQGVSFSAIGFEDVDGDDDQDLILTGQVYVIFDAYDISNLYLNDGSGNFTKVEDTPFIGVFEGAVGFSDVDNDGDQDLLITGEDIDEGEIARLYLNDGAGNFTENEDAPFEGVWEGTVSFADIDGDGDEDVLLTGEQTDGEYIAHLFTNNGIGDFSIYEGVPFESVAYGSIEFSDVDMDGDEDVLLTGIDHTESPFDHIYTNNGAMSFSLLDNTPFDGVWEGSVAFADVDGDNDEDVLITGATETDHIADLFLNDGTGNFVKDENNLFEDVFLSSIAFSDVDNDGDQDVLISGADSMDIAIAHLYINDGAGFFTFDGNSSFEGAQNSSVAFADVDNDGDEDVMITGEFTEGVDVLSQLYINDGTGIFFPSYDNFFIGVAFGTSAFADVDNDGDQDLLVTGSDFDFVPITTLYLNDGSGFFEIVEDTPFVGVENSDLDFSDVDADGDLDVMISGSDSDRFPTTILYLNDGQGNFTIENETVFEQLDFSSVGFSDVDNDGDEDLLISGFDFDFRTVTKLYINDFSVSTEEIIADSKAELAVFPNPATNEQVTILYTSEINNEVQIILTDMTGKIIAQQLDQVVEGQNNIQFPLSNLPAGAYNIQLLDGSNSSYAKLIIQ